MKTINDILTVAFGKLTNDHAAMTIYKQKHPKFFKDDDPGVFFVINSLPVVTGYVEQAVINVNIHVDEIDPGKPDFDKMDQYTQSVITSLDEYRASGVEFYYQSHGNESSPLTGKDYVNVRFKVIAENG